MRAISIYAGELAAQPGLRSVCRTSLAPPSFFKLMASVGIVLAGQQAPASGDPPPQHLVRSVSSQFDHVGPRRAAELDQLELAESVRWHNFYSDRTRPCPFFGTEPDENLVEWVESGRIEPGAALDIGCGNGRNSIYLARNGFSATGADLSEQAIAWACERATEQAVHVRFECGSIFDFALAPQSLGFIYDSGCFHHVPPHRRAEYAQLIARALRPGGQFGLVCFTPEGGSGLTDEQTYERGSLGGGLGYSSGALREFWCRYLDVVDLRRMNEVPAGAGRFGRNFLWVLLAHARQDKEV